MKCRTPAYAFGLATVVAIITAGCAENGPSPLTPTPPQAPAPPQPGPPADTFYTLSGVVYEQIMEVKKPREGVSIYCDSCGSPEGHTYTTTDRNGAFAFTHTKNGATPLIVSETGNYRVDEPTAQVMSDGSYVVVALVNGDTQFNIRVAYGIWDY